MQDQDFQGPVLPAAVARQWKAQEKDCGEQSEQNHDLDLYFDLYLYLSHQQAAREAMQQAEQQFPELVVGRYHYAESQPMD